MSDKKNLCSAISIIALLLLGSTLAVNEAFAGTDAKTISTQPPIKISKSGSPSPVGLNPVQIGHAYGFDLLSCYGTSSCGSGQTIAIVDAFDDPNIESDLAAFSAQYGLPSCTTANGCFTKATPQGLPKANTNWALEESLDVEWAHAMAPGAKIILVEAQDVLLSSLLGAVDYAVVQPNVHQVSMSWAANEFFGESSYDYHFNVAGVSFIASSGDSVAGVSYPAASPYVVSVGGTTLNIQSTGKVQSETAWSGSGGGVSSQESKPSYQTGFNSNSGRGVPDVSYVADPNTGVSIYDSFGYGGWNQVGGTSVGAPQWAAITAIVNSGGGQLSSASFGTNTALYNAATGSAYSANYRDITTGNNGNCGTICNAGPNYDFVTGLGSPLTNNLIPYLQPPDFTITANPSSLTINSGSSGSSTITVTSINGFIGTVSLSSSAGSSLDVYSLTVGSGGTATATLTITNPSSSGTYTVSGSSRALSHSADVTVTVLIVQSAPQNLVATPGKTQVALTWSAPASNGGATITGYSVYRGTASNGEDATPIATVGTTSYTDSGLTNGQTYFYKVTAVNSVGGSSQSNEASATPVAIPSAPQNLVAFSGNAQVGLTWSAPSSNGGSAITGYDVYRGTLPGGEGATPIATVGTTSYTDSGLTNGQTYYYKVTAINSAGQSSSSNEASATPQLPALSVSVTTDKPVYSKGSASITVTVTNSTSAPISGASVTLTVTAPNGNTSQSTGTTDSNGQVIFSYHMTKPGTYTAGATATKSGYLYGSGSTT